MSDVLFSSRFNYKKTAVLIALAALIMSGICVFLLNPSAPLLDMILIRRVLTRFPDHRETAIAMVTALGVIAMLIAFFLFEIGIRLLYSGKRIGAVLVVTSKSVKIPDSFMYQGIIIPVEHIISVEMAEHAVIELAYNSVAGRKIIEIPRRMYENIDSFIPTIQKLITAKLEFVEERFSISLNKAGLSEQETSEKINVLSTLLNKPASQIQAAFKDDLFSIRKGLVKDQAAKVIAQLKARGLPVAVSKNIEHLTPQSISSLPSKLISIVPAFTAAAFSVIPGGSTLWVIVMWFALNQLPTKFKLNPLLILATIALECFVDASPLEGPSAISSLVIWILALSGISVMMRNDIAKTYNATPNLLLTLMLPIFYVTNFANKLLIKPSENESACANTSAYVQT